MSERANARSAPFACICCRARKPPCPPPHSPPLRVGRERHVTSVSPLDSGAWVHLNCALWSSEVYESVGGELLCVTSALQRAKKTACAHCGQMGATVGCNVHRCPKSYHFGCAFEAGALLLQDKRLFCNEHRECKQVERRGRGAASSVRQP